MIKALAKLVYDFAFSRYKDEKTEEYLEHLLENMHQIDFSHTNPCWRYYEMSQDERISNGISSLSEYLPVEKSGINRDIGGFDRNSSWMRFGAKHNDIYPVLGDMIRWQLKLPSRHKS